MKLNYFDYFNFDYSQILKLMLQTEWKKSTEKWSHLSSFHVPFLSYGIQIF